MKRLLLLLGAIGIFVACGIRAAPQPPAPQAEPMTGDPHMVPTSGTLNTPVPPDTHPLTHAPSYVDGGPPWLLKEAADAGAAP